MCILEKEYYSLEGIADKLKYLKYYTVDDLLHYAEIGKLEICVYIDSGRYEVHRPGQEIQKIKKAYKEYILDDSCPIPLKKFRINVYTDREKYERARQEAYNIKKEYVPGGPCPILLKHEGWRNLRMQGHLLPLSPQGDIIIIKHPQEDAYITPIKRDYAISDLIVTHKEKLRFKEICDLASNTKATTHSKPPHRININEPHEVDEFVGSLTIYPENDDTINIQIPGRKAEPFTAHSLGFHKTGKEWRLLQKIIQEGRYCTGSTKTNEGDANRKRLTTVNKKIIKFLNENFNAEIPPDYKLFEISAEHEKGTWKPKFKIGQAGKYSTLTKEQILEKIKEECNKDKSNKDIISELVMAAKEKGISNDELKSFIPSNHKDDEVYDYEEGGHITNKL